MLKYFIIKIRQVLDIQKVKKPIIYSLPSTNSKVFGVILLVLFMLSPALYASMPLQTGDNNGLPKIVFESESYNAGLVKPGDKVQGLFVIKNEGAADLVIEKIVPS